MSAGARGPNTNSIFPLHATAMQSLVNDLFYELTTKFNEFKIKEI